MPVANDAFAGRVLITGADGEITVDNTGCGTETGEPRPDAGGLFGPHNISNTVWYEWVAPNTGAFALRVKWVSGPAGIDTLHQGIVGCNVYTGSAVNALTRVSPSQVDTARAGDTNGFTEWNCVVGVSYKIQLGTASTVSGTSDGNTGVGVTMSIAWNEAYRAERPIALSASSGSVTTRTPFPYSATTLATGFGVLGIYGVIWFSIVPSVNCVMQFTGPRKVAVYADGAVASAIGVNAGFPGEVTGGGALPDPVNAGFTHVPGADAVVADVFAVPPSLGPSSCVAALLGGIRYFVMAAFWTPPDPEEMTADGTLTLSYQTLPVQQSTALVGWTTLPAPVGPSSVPNLSGGLRDGFVNFTPAGPA